MTEYIRTLLKNGVNEPSSQRCQALDPYVAHEDVAKYEQIQKKKKTSSFETAIGSSKQNASVNLLGVIY